MRNIIRAISGLSFFERTNCKDWFVIASYHHPDSITWRWSLSYYLPTKKKLIGDGLKSSLVISVGKNTDLLMVIFQVE